MQVGMVYIVKPKRNKSIFLDTILKMHNIN